MTLDIPALAEEALTTVSDASAPPDSVRLGNNTILSLCSLSLHNFRNYVSARMETSPQPVVLTGHNGAGKTNILEAISLLTPGRGLRRAKLSEMDYISSPLEGEGRVGGRPRTAKPAVSPLPNPPPQGGRGKECWAVSAHICGIQGNAMIGTGRDPADDAIDKRIIKIDGKIIRGQADLARHLAIIWLTPQMERLFQEGASSARKFLDRLVYSFDAEQATRVSEYEFAMRERNKLLQADRSDPHWLDALEQTMAETGAAIAQARLLTCDHINHAIAHSPLSFPKAHISIHGFMEDRLRAGDAAVQAEEAFMRALHAGRAPDGAAGRTLTGAHRSEMNVLHVEKHMPAESCSTGEQKAMLLSIVLAQARAGLQWHGVVPVLLLDEVVAHLDARRRAELFEEIRLIGAQAWMTGTDASLFHGLENHAQFYKIGDGLIAI